MANPKQSVASKDVATTQKPGKFKTSQGEFTVDEVQAFLAKAHKGDKQAWAIVQEVYGKQLQQALLEATILPDVQARTMLLDAVLGNDLPVKDSYKAHAEQMQRELEGPNPSALERLLCQRVVTCWLDVNFADGAFFTAAQRRENDAPFALMRWHEYRRERANNRYLAAMTALARVRRLLAPIAQQVNIAQPGAQQLNVAQPGTAQENHVFETEHSRKPGDAAPAN